MAQATSNQSSAYSLDAARRAQRFAALEYANRVRFAHRDAKNAVRELGAPEAMRILNDPSEMIESLRIIDLLCAIPKIGPMKAGETLSALWCPRFAPLGSLTERQRNGLCDWLESLGHGR